MERDLTREAAANRMAAALRQRIDQGGVAEAVLRALIFVRGPEGSVDERGFRALEEINAAQPQAKRLKLPRFKETLREQFLIMKLDEERAIAAIPRLLPEDSRKRDAARAAISRVLGARGNLSEDSKQRLERIEALFSKSEALFSKSVEARAGAEKQPSLAEG